ncbi:sacsin-like [Haliotis rufescens]|uniref:sacsin-like n=1 Tax=Haliotis rufescens TaxID=6454 RepID=UPI00201F6AEA|nr:sacsin-like [Haliotis rufescens]
MSQDSESDDDGYRCMELPTLIKQLKSVMDQYPDGGQILKELIQNAEDAKASEMRILYDVRHIDPDPRLLKKKRYLASLQAPALCVYNDALFTEKDWRGIKMLHDSVKEEEPLKVGRFGLGFKSVFHVTDFPCVISGDTVLFINPQEKNSDRVCYMKKLRDLSNEIKKMILNVFSGIFDFTSDTVHKGYYSGTIFWFPLRTNISKLSDNLYTEEKVMDLFQAFKSEASITLLFLKSIEKIQLYQRLRRKIQVQFSLQLSQDCLQDVRMEKQDFIRKVKQAQGGIPAASVESQLTLTVETVDVAGPKASQQWIVINFYKGGTMSPRFRDLCSDKALSYAPYVGLAVPLGQQCKGHVFCFLPLPLEGGSPIGLQVHVNGFFALNQNRRHVKWPTADQLQNQAHTDKAMEWNKCLVSEVLPDVYYSIVNALVQCCKVHTNSIIIIQQIYRMIPDIDDVDVNWKPLVSTLLKQLHNIPLLFTPSDKRMGIKMKDAFLVDVANDAYSLIVEIFTLYKKYIVPVPSKLMKTLEKHFSSHIHKATPKDVCDTLRLSNHFTRLPRQKKLMLLKYLLESDQYKHLEGLCLLPVADGNFVAFGAPAAVFICDQPEDVKLFPGLESQLVSADLAEDLQQALMKRAAGGWKGLSVMSSAAFPGLLQKCLLRHFPEGNAKLPSPSLDVSWLRQVWTYITAHGFDVESVFSGLLIVPDIDASDRGRLHSIDDVFIAQSVRHSESLPPNVGAALQKLGIVHLMYVPDFVLKNSYVLGTIIQYSNPVGVVRALEKVYRRKLITAVQLFNSESSKQERSALVAYMSTCQLSEGSKAVLRKLQLFTATDNSDCSVETLCTLAPDEQIPVPYPERYIQCSSAAVRHLALTLGATERPFLDVSRRILQMMLHNKRKYTESHMVDFMEFLMENHLHIVNETRQIASEVRFLSSSGGSSGLRACDLFSQDDPFVKDLFLGEDKFPADRHTRRDRLRRGLEAIGLKTEKEVSESDVRTSAKTIEELVIRGMESEAGRKVTAFITFLERSTYRMDVFKLSDLQHLQCIPCMQKRISRYPKSLSWKGESGPKILSSGKVFSSRYSSIIGSVSPVAKKTTAAVEAILGLDRVPPVCSVMEHLHNLGTSYDSRECNPCMDLLKDIYSFLSSQDVSSTEKNMMESSQSVWVGIEEGFHSPRSVYCERSDADLDLKPYRYQLPSLLHGWGSLLCSYGCHQRQTPDMLATVLEEIKEKHDEFKTANLKKPTVVRQDLKLVLQILNELQEHPQRPDHVLVPVHQASDDFLLLLPAESCTYCNADWLQDQTSDDSDDDDEEIFFVHASVSELTAKLLNVSSLTDRVMGDTEDFDMNYQQTEPLTRRLKNLLHEYTDGFSAPKELIQNADDAAATEVCFMYDERQNLNARTSLMNENMAALQGPAFWAYNDATFQECDFDHIKKLSGATKEEDTTKVGKFGLGFNSVYNLTDVPSFISENNVVIFDPHKLYLGRPGLRANLKSVKNGKMLRKMSGQFKPFEGIFGCNFSGNADKICPGTLFRFPLRTQEQADASEIKDLVYSRHEMENFFRKFVEGCGNLLLFTQNVQSVKFFHIPPRGEPSQPELLVHVRKTIQDRKVLSPSNSFLNGPNVLSYAAEEWKKQSGLSLKISEKSDVQLEICDTDMTRMQKLKAGVTIVSWLITWVTGQGESEQFARSGKLKGLLPLAAVAIPLTLEDGRQCIYNMDKCPEGFYREGHFFCFLPLPVHIPFPVHINAPFALTSDRRQLCTQTEDDKTNSEAEWNTALFKDATCRAYVAALEQLEITDPSTVGQYYDLWPTMQRGQDCMVRSFYEFITHEAHDVFLHDDNGNLEWLSFQRIYILEPTICGKNRKLAYKAAAKFWNRTNEKIIDLPQNLLEQFYLSGLESKVSSRLIRESEFFKTIFFRNIHDSYWSNSQTERDSLVLFALKCQDESVQDLIKGTRCIPTEPSGTLKLPGEVIRPNSPCADLFSEEDECFPRGYKFGETQFCDLNVIKILCKLGMIQDKLPWEILVERARSVEKLAAQDAKRARERSGRILRYLVIRDKHGKKLFDDLNEDIKSTLQGIPFLPILKHPTSWHLHWKADDIPETLFACPNELHDKKLSSLVACSQLMLDDSFDCNMHVDVEVLSWLEVKGKEDVVLEDVANQLLSVSETINSGTTLFNELEKMCKDLYACLNEQYHKSKFSIIRDILKNKDIVVAEKRLLKPQQVAFSLPCDLSPDLYQVDKAFDIYKPFLQSIGVRERFGLNDILAVIGNITKEAGTKPLSQSRLKWFGLAAQYIQLLDISDFRPEGFDISLPNSKGIMSKAVSLCIDDCEYVVHDESMTFVHKNIHQNVAKLFGVKGKREVDLKNHICSSFSEFGQCEKLTTRLKGLLSGYPCDSSLMKELLQNADDAGATELMFIKDFRHLPIEKLFCDEWASLQGPALCVFNDSFFTEGDIEGIQNLGVGSKSDDPVKTGQYGVGFNAVYHLTDVPSFITVGPGMEKSICALDPHMQYVPGCKSGKPGVRISQLDRIRDTYADSFSGYLEDIVRTDTKGTLFRFPLRTQEMATKSKIKDKKVDPDDVNKLLEEFKNDMFDSLLFLHNVKKISIARVSRNGIFKEYCVEASMSEADMSKHKQFLSHLRNQTKMIQDCSSQTGLNAVSPLKVQLSLRVKDSQGKQQDWIVSHQSGFVKEKSIPDVITTTWKNGDIRLLPRGGVAMPLADAEKNFEGKAFCTLPLPISTGLPVHVNGHFALDHEARRNLWYGSDDYRSAWNRHVVDAVIVPAYISAVKLIKKSTEINHKTAFKCLYDKIYHSYYTFFPDRSCTKSEVWGDLVVSFYTDVVLKKREIFSVIKPAEGLFAERTKRTKENMMCKVEWVPAACSKGFPGYFNNLEKETTDDVPPGSSQCWKQENENAVRLKEILKDLNMKVIDSPSRIYKDIFATCKEPVSEVTPTNVMHFLKTHFLKVKDGCSLRLPMELARTSLRNVELLQRLTQFCKKQQKFCSELHSLPLALTASMNLYKFDPSKPFFVTKFTELLAGTPDQVLHKDIVDLYGCYESPCLKELDICSLAALLGQTLSADVLQTGKPVYWKDNTFPSKQWIFRFWDYLATQIYGSKSNQTLVTKATLTKVEDWSLLPATKHGDGSLMLYPIKESWCVIDMNSVNEKAHQTALHHMNVPQLERNVLKHTSSLPFDNRACAVASSSLASWENPGTVLKLISNLDFSSWNNVSPQDCQAILEFFSRNVDKLNDPQAAKQLKKIPLYESLGGSLVDLQNHTTIFSVEILMTMPSEGFDDWTSASKILLLKFSASCRKLYHFLGVQERTDEKLYVQYILPNFNFLPDSTKPKHLKYIRDQLLKKATKFSPEQCELIKQLKDLKFIEAGDGMLHCAGNFYSSDVEVFREMCQPNELLPPPYAAREWQHFVELAGLKTKVTEELYLLFARKVERSGQQGITENIERKSKALISYLTRHYKHFRNLTEIGKIKFVLPYSVNEELTSIFPQHNEGKYLVSYSESLSPCHCHYVWTSCSIFNQDADPRSWLSADRIQHFNSLLGIQTVPTSERVTRHLQNICTSLINIQDQNDGDKLSKLDHFIQEVMKANYKHLLDTCVTDEMKIHLQDFSIIYVPADKCMVSADRVVKNIRSDDIMKGYLYAIPDEFFEFHQIFIDLGASKDVNANLYVRVLEKLYKETNGKSLHLNELSVAKKAIDRMVFFMQRESMPDTRLKEQPSLYLPDNSLVLTDSRNLVYNNDKRLSERVEFLELPYFLGFQKLELNMDENALLSMLPECYRLKLLTSFVKEHVTEESKQRAYTGDLAQKYKNIVQGSEFVSAVVRLVNHESILLRTQGLDISEAKDIEQRLALLEIQQVNNLKTELWENGNVVPGSQCKRAFLRERNKRSKNVCLFIDSKIKSITLLSALAVTVDNLTSRKLGSCSAYLHHLLGSKPEIFNGYLDEFKIKPYGHVGQQREQTAFPPPGTLIPEDMHWLLDNSFHVFDEGEYVGLEVYDPLVDTDSQDEEDANANPVYIYAIVKKVVCKEDMLFRQKYVVNVGDDREEEILGLKLYKFWREKTNKCRSLVTTETSTSQDELQNTEQSDLESVLKEIRQILTDTWRNCSDQERNRVKKRLYLKWHPDKNPGREDFCTKVCQNIQKYVMRLENGQSIEDVDDEDIGTQRTSYGASRTNSSFFEHMNRRSSNQRNHYERHKRTASSSENYRSETFYKWHHSARDDAHPQPQEAKRWLRQATFDLQAAWQSSRQYNTCSNNWVLFKAQQAAEKAIKSVWFNRNANVADGLRNHDITITSRGLNNPQLSELASQLQCLIGDFNRMRYPDRLSFPSIPADVYTDDNARQACQVAQKILNLVKELLDHD